MKRYAPDDPIFEIPIESAKHASSMQAKYQPAKGKCTGQCSARIQLLTEISALRSRKNCIGSLEAEAVGDFHNVAGKDAAKFKTG
jgi:hypothetical protein